MQNKIDKLFKISNCQKIPIFENITEASLNYFLDAYMVGSSASPSLTAWFGRSFMNTIILNMNTIILNIYEHNYSKHL